MSDEDDEAELDPGRALYQRLKREREQRERDAAAARALPPQPPPEQRTMIFLPEPAGPRQGQLAPGVPLNQIYEIRRYIASGGMGEVYEGVNVATEERVA